MTTISSRTEIVRIMLALSVLRRVAVGCIVCTALCGCVATQLKVDTGYLGGTVEQITRAQIIENLRTFGGNPWAIPSQFILGSGSASVSNQFTPSTPGSNPIMFSGQVLRGISLQDQNQTALGWGVTPVTDFSDLRRLSALYRYALGEIGMKEFLREYDGAYVAVTPTAFQVPPRHPDGTPPTSGELSAVRAYFYLPLPPASNDNPNTIANDADGLNWPDPLPSAGFISLEPKAGYVPLRDSPANSPVYVEASNGEEYFHDFTLWVLGATPNSVGSSGGGKPAKGGGAAAPRAPPQFQ